ncbi:carbohydrate kinase [Labilibacter sediminis]|nr:carbohydrate kinase [Labilibacter sediminis]
MIDRIFNKKILCFGECLWDCLPSGDKAGGAPMNVAIHLNQLGVSAAFATKVGHDKRGQQMLDFISSKGLHTPPIQVDESYDTGIVKVMLDDNNNASYDICSPAAWDNIKLTPKLRELAKQTDILISGSLVARNSMSRKTLLELMADVKFFVLDVNLRAPYDLQEVVEPLIKKADFVKVNDEEIIIISAWNGKAFSSDEEAMRWLKERYDLSVVCLTRGDKGAAILWEDTYYNHQGIKAKVVRDTIGAGDAFLASLMTALIKGFSIQEALDKAIEVGAYLVTQEGATPQLPKEIKAIFI